jgi:hypothetical protein
MAAALAVGLLPTGCVIIRPNIPRNAIGYGQTYQIVDQSGQPVSTGLLLLESNYTAMPSPSPMLGAYEIRNGSVQVRRRTGLRYISVLGGEPGSMFPPGLYFGQFVNTDMTLAYVLVPGQVPVSESLLGAPVTIGADHPPPNQIVLSPVNAGYERLYLDECRDATGPLAWSRQTSADRAAKKRIIEYIDRRLQELPADHGVTIRKRSVASQPTRQLDESNASSEGLEDAERDIQAFKKTLKDKSPEELIASFIPMGEQRYGGYEYYYKYMANIEIRQELKARGAAAYVALRSHSNDHTEIWEAINGPGDTIGRICTEVLKERSSEPFHPD